MVWKEVKVEEQKLNFINEYIEAKFTFTELCQAYEISRKTGYKWVDRFRPLSFFEKGIFKTVLGKNPEKMVVSSSLYEEISKGPSQANPSFSSPSFPTYYGKFKWESRNSLGFQTLDESLSLPYLNAYTLLSIEVAHLFQDDEKRKKLGIPGGNSVACLIVSEKGEILSWGVNTVDEKDMIRHAEVNAVGAYFKRHANQTYLPGGAILFTSLKSCHMCSGLIRDSIDPGNPIKVKYAQTDPTENETGIETVEEKIDHPIIKAIDDAYSGMKQNKKNVNAASCLKENDFQPLLTDVSTSLDALLSTGNTTLVEMEINDFLTHIRGL